MFAKIFKAYEMLKDNAVSRQKKVFIRGAGYQGKVLFFELKTIGIIADAFITPECENFPEYKLFGIPVISPDEVYRFQKGSYFVINSIENNDIYYQIKDEVQHKGLNEEDFIDFGVKADRRFDSNGINILDIYTDYDLKAKLDRRCGGYKNLLKAYGDDFKWNQNLHREILAEHNPIIDMNLMITERCTLNCKSCNAGMPMYSNPVHFQPDNIISGFEKILSVNRLAAVAIIGGEPLCHPELAHLLIGLANIRDIESKVSYFVITTNGTLDIGLEVIEAIKVLNEKVAVNVQCSNYGKKSTKIIELKEKLGDNSIKLLCYDENFSWTYLGEPSYSRNYSRQQLEHVFSVCNFPGGCTVLADGRFYSCDYVCGLDKAGLCPSDDSLFVDVRNMPADKLRETLENFIFGTRSLSACQYCDGFYDMAATIPKAIQLERGCYNV
jgi:organic radical activating enzyme